MTEKMTEELYKALYTVLDNDKENKVSLENDVIRNKTLKTLLGVEEKQLSDQIKKYNKIQKAREELGNEDANITGTGKFKDIVEYWKAIHHLYVCYLDKLKKSLKEENKTINKILIYEAPPMPSKKKDENFGKINYILAESCRNCKPLKDGKPCDLLTNEPKGAYSTTIDELTNKNQKIQDILVNQGILFIDLCPLPLPMTTKIRKTVWGEKWGEYFVEEDKPLAVVLLELALKFALEKGIKISKEPIIAMGTPTATSQSIYLYFEQIKSSGCLTKTFTSIDGNLNIDFSKLLEINEKYDKENQILPLYKSNIIAGSNTPNAELLKRIFFENPVKI